MKSFRKQALACAVLFVAASSHLKAQQLQSIDFTPIDGTTWADSSVRLDFGSLGYGTVTFISVNGGAFANAASPFSYNAAPYSSYSGPTELSNGAIFSPTQESVFSILTSSNEGLSGFTMVVQLDSGAFPENSYFSVRSLGANGSDAQYVQPLTGLEGPDSTQLPTDGHDSVGWGLADPDLNLYGAESTTSTSKGLAFNIVGNSFSANLLTTTNYNPGGVAMTIVTPVPEPSGTVIAGLGGVMFLARRRRQGPLA